MSLPVVIFSSYNDLLTLFLTKELVSRGCSVSLFAQDFSDDVKQAFPKSVSFIDISQAQTAPASYYFFIASGGILKSTLASKKKKINSASTHSRYFELLKQLSQTDHGKVVAVFPLLGNAFQNEIQLVRQLPLSKTLLVGDLYQEHMDSADGREISTILSAIAYGQPVPVSSDSSELYIISAKAAAGLVARAAFSYWYKGRGEVETLTTVSNYSAIIREFSHHNVTVTLQAKNNLSKLRPRMAITKPKTEEVTFLETVSWIQQSHDAVPVVAKAPRIKKLSTPKIKLRKSAALTKTPVKRTISIERRRVKVMLLTLVGLLWIAFLPILLLGSGGIALKLAADSLIRGDQKLTTSLLTYSRTAGRVSQSVFTLPARMPILAPIGESLGRMSQVVVLGSELAQEGVSALDDLAELKTGILGNKEYDVDAVSTRLSVKLDTLYKESGVLQSMIAQSQLMSAFIPQDIDLVQGRELLWASKEFTKTLPTLISGQGQKTYMVLLQNNMELRPTGGFVGSFALLTFDRGKLLDTTVLDVYSADGQLKGHVEPPAPIRAYLGEANWYLRDSNWDPDFRVSAEHAQWFLNKELDRDVDGVFAMDLEVVKALLEFYGPITLPDFNVTLDHKNLGEKLHHEIESEFFPGSTKKASLLTGLSESLLAKLTSDTEQSVVDELHLGNILLSSLNEKHLLLNFDDTNAQSIADRLNWSAALPHEGNWLEVVDANVGVNKANYYIERLQDLKIELTPSGVSYTLSVRIKNNAEDPLDSKNIYKTYLRAVVPSGEFSQITIQNGSTVESKQPEVVNSKQRVEAGVVVSIPPTEERMVTFTWKTNQTINFGERGEFPFAFIKQPGTIQDPTKITISIPHNLTIKAAPRFDLTRGRDFSYNLNLAEDFHTSIAW